MARSVHEIMNPELVSIRVDSRADETLDTILQFGITAVPVLDAEGRPIGVSSLRDLVRHGPKKAPMTTPATTIAMSASVAAAAETMATTNRHHLVVVGSDGKAVGMVSTLDVLRALLGRPTKHPAAFSRHDAELDTSWSNDEPLDPSVALPAVPEEPGVLLLVRGGVDCDEVPVWAEATANLRSRVRELVAGRAVAAPALAEILRGGSLRFRYSVVADEGRRATILERVRDRLVHQPPPGGT
jgi:CBS domain-containing protein